MSKKMMKRSLALGALMAFVITGSAMAASVKNAEINTFKGSEVTVDTGWDTGIESGRAYGIGAQEAGKYVLNTEKFLTITNKQTGKATRNYGIVIESGTSLTVKNAVSIDVANSGDYRAVGIRNNYGKDLIFEEDVTVNATSTGNGDGMTSIGVDAWGENTIFNDDVDIDVDATNDGSGTHTRGVQVGGGANIKFNGNKTVITADNKGGTIAGVGFAAFNGGGTVYFNSKTTEITVGSASGLAYGLNCIYSDNGNYYFGYNKKDDGSLEKVGVDSATITVNSGEGGCAVGISGTLNVSDGVKLFKVIAEGPANFQNNGNDATAGISVSYKDNTSTIKSEKLVVDVKGSTTAVDNSYLSGVDAGNYATLNIDSKDIYISVVDNSGNDKAYAVHTSAIEDSNYIPGKGTIRVGKDGVSKVVVIGDVMTADYGSVTMNLGTADSIFTGAAYTDNTSTTIINMANGATWNVTGDSKVTTLAGNSGKLELTYNNDEGRFVKVDIDNLTNEALEVTGGEKLTQAIESGKVNVSNEEVLADLAEAVAAEEGSIAVVKIEEGNILGEVTASVDANGQVVAGSVKEAVNTVNKSIGEASVVGMAHIRAHMNDMNKRMGELRMANGESGVWTRMVRGEEEFAGAKSQYNQYQLGYDEKLSVDKRWTVGAAVTFAEGNGNFANGSTENDSTAFAIYGSKLNNDGTFVDLIARYARFESDITVADAKADYSTNGMSVSAEFGKRIQQGNGLWIEPQVELTYGSVDSAEYKLGDKNVQVGDMDSLIGRVGFSLGKDIKQGNVYARASYLYDFDGETETTFGNGNVTRTIAEDLGGGWWEVGVGANINLSKATYIYADVEKTFGGEVDTNWKWNLGVRYSF